MSMFLLGLLVGLLLSSSAFAPALYRLWVFHIKIPITARVFAALEILRADKELLEAIVNRKEDPYKEWIVKFAQWRLKRRKCNSKLTM